MCGIAGFLGRASVADATGAVRRMVARLRHRGPDHQAVEPLEVSEDLVLALGHTRLAIIDAAGGNQPFYSSDGRYALVYNGEIYNYLELRDELQALGVVFHTRSDTEVLLQACITWGPKALARFRGMFAFALWDHQDRSLLLARDHFGEKPLFYHLGSDGLSFASELGALLANPLINATLDSDALADYLIFKYAPGTGSLVRNVKQIRPGNYAVYANGSLTESAYYRPPAHSPSDSTAKSEADLIEAFRAKLTESVRLRMRSDVEVGSYLSGGIDSSAIVSLMSKETHRKVKTFSVGFKDAAYDELWAARMMAKHIDTDHHEVVVEPHHYIDYFARATWHRGAPLSELADIPLFCLGRLASQSVKVVLSGEGSDELLAGYPKHWGERYVGRYHRIAPRAVDTLNAKIGRRLAPGNHRVESLARALTERDFVDRQAAWFGSVSRADFKQIAPQLIRSAGQDIIWPDDPGARVSSLSRVLLFDQMVWLPGTLLPRGDRMAMAWAVEGRVPFLDPELAAFIARLPDNMLLRGRTGKWILRRAMDPFIPSAIIDRPKHGFRVPFADWLRSDLREFVHDNLLSPSTHSRSLVDQQRINAMLLEHDCGKRDRAREIWSLLSLEIFLQQLDTAFEPA